MKIVLALLLLACNNNNSHAVDAPSIDIARPDALLDAPIPPPGAHRFVVDHEQLPTNNNEARAYGLDLDNDGIVDNQLGMVFAAFSGMGLPLQPRLDHAIDSGAIEILADVEATDLTTASQATVALFDGTNAMPSPCTNASDTTCRHHLAGTATFDVASTTQHDTPLSGGIVAGILDVGPGMLHLRSAIFGTPVDLQLVGARIKLTQPSDTAIMTGNIAGAITQSEIDASLIPALQIAVSAQIALDCSALTSPPACGCISSSTGATFIGLFDVNQDCAVTQGEIKNNSLMMSLLAPDVSIDGMQALSLGVRVSAVHAAFTP